MSDHYFTESPSTPEQRKTITLRLLDGTRVKIETASGVFSADDIDEGTDVLIRKSPAPEAGQTVLDLGCGYGTIALTFAHAVPDAKFIAIDVNERALGLTRDNVKALKLKNVTVADPHSVDPKLAFDVIYSNPPIRIGKKEMQGMLKGWLMRLAPEGVAYLVVHKHLGSDSLQKWLNENSWDCERLASAKGYRILEVRRAEAASQ